MSLHLDNITFDCHDAQAVAGFWSSALGRPLDQEPARRIADKDEWGHRWTVMTDPEGNEFCVGRPVEAPSDG